MNTNAQEIRAGGGDASLSGFVGTSCILGCSCSLCNPWRNYSTGWAFSPYEPSLLKEMQSLSASFRDLRRSIKKLRKALAAKDGDY